MEHGRQRVHDVVLKVLRRVWMLVRLGRRCFLQAVVSAAHVHRCVENFVQKRVLARLRVEILSDRNQASIRPRTAGDELVFVIDEELGLLSNKNDLPNLAANVDAQPCPHGFAAGNIGHVDGGPSSGGLTGS